MAEQQKKGIFARLFGQQKGGGCCSHRIEEIAKGDSQEGAQEQGSPKGSGSCCCGPAPDPPDSDVAKK